MHIQFASSRRICCCCDVIRYKSDLAAALEREARGERDRTQLELDWQRKCEAVERVQYERSEDLLKKLTTARDGVTYSQLTYCKN